MLSSLWYQRCNRLWKKIEYTHQINKPDQFTLFSDDIECCWDLFLRISAFYSLVASLWFLFGFASSLLSFDSNLSYSSSLVLVRTMFLELDSLLEPRREPSGADLFTGKSRRTLTPPLKIDPSFEDLHGHNSLNQPDLKILYQIYSSLEAGFGLTYRFHVLSPDALFHCSRSSRRSLGMARIGPTSYWMSSSLLRSIFGILPFSQLSSLLPKSSEFKRMKNLS